MKRVTIVGTGYVGLVTGVCLAEIGHRVTCIDIDQAKVDMLINGKSPIYEPGLEALLEKNIENGNLDFTTEYAVGLNNSNVVFIAVGTPPKKDGSVELKYIENVAEQIASNTKEDVIVVTKSTVPVGTNERILEIITKYKRKDVKVEVVSNPEFLREGTAIADTFYGDRIVIGTNSDNAAAIMEEIYKPFNIPIFKTDIRSAEMIKYASNAFLATKISYINEIATLCELVDANIEDVSKGMGYDTRIGSQFLKAGIGFGGSCFPKDTSALIHLSSKNGHHFDTLQCVINVNERQKSILVNKARKRFGNLAGKKFALLGLAFKPNTDDMREAPSITIAKHLIEAGAEVKAYDPIATNNAKQVLDDEVRMVNSIEEAVRDTDAVFIVTEWKEIIDTPLSTFVSLMKHPIIFDGRNCFPLDLVKNYNVEYHSIGRMSVNSIEMRDKNK